MLLPAAKYTLNYRGGPDITKYAYYNIHLVWSVYNSEIATIDSTTGFVQALHIGETKVNLKMMKKQALLTEAFGKISVKLVTSVGILGMTPGRIVLKDSATRLIA